MTIKEARESRGFSRAEIVNMIGIPYRTLQSWENGDRKTPEWVERLVVNEINRMERA